MYRWAPLGERLPEKLKISSSPRMAVAAAAPAKRSSATERLPIALITQPACSLCSPIQASSAWRRSSPDISRNGTTFMGMRPPTRGVYTCELPCCLPMTSRSRLIAPSSATSKATTSMVPARPLA